MSDQQRVGLEVPFSRNRITEAAPILTLPQSFSDKSNNQETHFPMKVFHQKPTISKEAPRDRRSGKER